MGGMQEPAISSLNEYLFAALKLPEIFFGIGASNRLAEALDRLTGGEVLVITDKGLVAAGIVDRLCRLMESAGRRVNVFDEVEQDPEIDVAQKAIDFARLHDPNVIVGIGGGSPLDVAKVTAALLHSKRTISEFFGFNKIEGKGIPTVLIPTTAGTGTEMAIGAVLSDRKNRLKRGILSPHLVCETAILDPELTMSCPRSITVSSGLDALTHAIEVYTNLRAQRMVDPLALAAIRMITANIRLVCSDGSNLQARSEMLLGSMYAGIGMQVVNNAAVHALSSPLGALYDIPHGVANAFLLPYVMEYNRSACVSRYARIAEAFGPTGSLDDEERSVVAVTAVKELVRSLGIRDLLSGLKVRAGDLPRLAESSLQVWLMANNPRKVTAHDAVAIYRQAFQEERVPVSAE